MTDTRQHETRQDTQKAAGELQGHTHNRHTEQATGTGTQQEQEERGEGSREGRKTHGSREGAGRDRQTEKKSI